MIIKIILSFGFLVLLAYALLARKSARIVALGMCLAALCGLFIIWFPEVSTIVANAMGVGRGADLIMYLWILASMLVALNLHLKCRELSRDLTRLARIAALDTAREHPAGWISAEPT